MDFFKLFFELIGTFLFVYVFIHINKTTGDTFKDPTLKTATICVTLFAIMLMFGSISGGYFNPAITVAKYWDNSLTVVDTTTYIIAQLCGGVAAYYLWNNTKQYS